MKNLPETETEYKQWLSRISSEYRTSQIRATIKVNEEMLKFYFTLGEDIAQMKTHSLYGDRFFQKLSADLQTELPNVKSFSPRNLNYIYRFYLLYAEDTILPQVVAKSQQNANTDYKTDIKSENDVNIQQIPESIFKIPWGHHRYIIDKCKGNRSKALFYVNKTIENNWSRGVLLNFLDSDLFKRQGKAVTNFSTLLPKPQSSLAQEMTHDPYSFDFLTLQEQYDEKDLKNALMDNISRFLLELGNGFSFVGREYRIDIGDTENYIDMLFYNINLHCYVVIEIKVTEFDSSYTGQLGTYVVAVNHQLKKEGDTNTIGLLICKTKDNIKAAYALESSSQPLGIASYELSKLIPEEYKKSMPTIEEIEKELEK